MGRPGKEKVPMSSILDGINDCIDSRFRLTLSNSKLMKSILRISFLLFPISFLFAATAQTNPPPTDASQFQIPTTDDGLPGAGPIRRYDWFRKLWTERRSGWAKRVQQDQNAVVFLGDSITQLWGDGLGRSFP